MQCKRGSRRRGSVPPRRFAGLVDAENALIVRGRLLPAAEGDALLTVVGRHLSGMPVQVATGERVLRPYMASFAARGWVPALVPTEPDAADLALLDAGRVFSAAGVTDIFLVSGDHIFTELAGAARLHVITHAHHLSRALRLAATTVTYLPSPAAPVKAVV
jgi:alkylation response protein AidB-like acyl-CoA dehydrogenase